MCNLRRCLAFLATVFSLTFVTACASSDGGAALSEPLLEGAAEKAGPGDPTDLRAKTLIKYLREPWGMDFLPDGRLLVTEKQGGLKLISPHSWTTVEISGVPEVFAEGQGGLMDVLVHPDFADNSFIYMSYSVPLDDGSTTQVARARLVADKLEDLETLFTALPAYSERRHYGSRLLLDSGYLYITVGDRGNRKLAQDLSTHNGKVIRLKESGEVPADNPFVATAGARPEIFSYGHRNPQGIAKHPGSDAIWVAEHGPQGGDEINILKAGTNYGWPIITYGEEYGGGKIGEGTHKAGMAQPMVYYTPSLGVGGIDFYTADTYPGWEQSLLVSGMRLTRLNRLELDGAGVGRETRLLGNANMRIRDVQVGPDGLVYLLADRSRLIRLELN
ncbi:PQQ-dependent sugar dehydrogenase [Halioglobus maricola]|uniref:PQQ-dependent sugar dehydrogenase n=1 Tax=Halioglobus maricola TaxID=2601894 RepID=A0A5P9NNU7_9GAMM|nr:PQQ-dependent sugar dehydrogenase [Halioglobus maricola]QFU77543.1 PQQ-dependent sugar dehydrogenase [Halioglobus maricola]